MVRRILLLALCCAFTAAPAQAFRLPANFGPLPGNPADKLATPIDDEVYDPATHCTGPKHRKGMLDLQRWLEAHSGGVFWGSYRCEMWGKHSASLHAEDRAVDWHLDVTVPADRRAAKQLIDTLLARPPQPRPCRDVEGRRCPPHVVLAHGGRVQAVAAS